MKKILVVMASAALVLGLSCAAWAADDQTAAPETAAQDQTAETAPTETPATDDTTAPADDAVPADDVTTWESPYTDVKDGDWFFDAVEYVTVNKLMSGTSDTTFSPNEETTRGMVVTTLWRLAGSPAQTAVEFDDVDADAWYAQGAYWAVNNNVSKGYAEKLMGPDKPITRQELATMFYSYAKMENKEPVGSWMIKLDYKDVDDIADWATEAIAYCTINEIMSGKPGDLFAPTDNVTRAELAKTIAVFAEVMKNTTAHEPQGEEPGQNEDPTQVPNPMVEYKTYDELNTALGYKMVTLTDNNKYTAKDYYAIDKTLGQIDYQKAKAEDPAKTAICLRQQKGNTDISGYQGVTYTQSQLYGVTINQGTYKAQTTDTLGDATIAWFVYGDYVYSLATQGIDATEFDVMLKDIVAQTGVELPADK